MKFNKLFAVLAVASLFCLKAQAQFDAYAGFTTLVVDAPRNLAVAAAGINSTTNMPVDIHGFDGIAKIDFSCFSNNVATTVLVAIQTSPDQTNWTSLANVSYAVPQSLILSNYMYGGILTDTNVFNRAGTVTSPTAATSGWATSYLVPAPFTNTASALDVSHNSIVTVGFNISDAGRYLRLVYTPSGTTTNWTGSAVLTAKRFVQP
jgi:hypothetical protein